MSGNKRRPKRGRPKERLRPDPESFWREDEQLARPMPITAPTDPTAALRSIGAPPVQNGDDVANEFLKTTLRASSLVSVLATSINLADP